MNKFHKASVMIIDDNEIDIFINQKVIEFSNFSEKVLSMNSGNDALAYLEKGDDLPNMIFLDLNMPVVDGFMFLLKFSKLPKNITDNIDVVVLTSSDNEHDKEKVAANPYVYKYVAKPLTEEKLDDLINRQKGFTLNVL